MNVAARDPAGERLISHDPPAKTFGLVGETRKADRRAQISRARQAMTRRAAGGEVRKCGQERGNKTNRKKKKKRPRGSTPALPRARVCSSFAVQMGPQLALRFGRWRLSSPTLPNRKNNMPTPQIENPSSNTLRASVLTAQDCGPRTDPWDYSQTAGVQRFIVVWYGCSWSARKWAGLGLRRLRQDQDGLAPRDQPQGAGFRL